MQKSLLAIAAAAISVMLLSTGTAYSYPFGDEPYRLNWEYDAGVTSGCLKWNWQQYLWNDYCPVYVHPKAYMYSHPSRVVLRTRG